MSCMHPCTGKAVDTADLIHIFRGAHIRARAVTLGDTPQGIAFFYLNTGIIADRRVTADAMLPCAMERIPPRRQKPEKAMTRKSIITRCRIRRPVLFPPAALLLHFLLGYALMTLPSIPNICSVLQLYNSNICLSIKIEQRFAIFSLL